MTFRGDPDTYKQQLKQHQQQMKKLIPGGKKLADIVSERLKKQDLFDKRTSTDGSKRLKVFRKKRRTRKSDVNPID